MNTNLTEIGFVLDRSGSMASMAEEAIGDSMPSSNHSKQLPGDAKLTLVLFDHEYLVMYDGCPIKEVLPLDKHTYVPRGSTALLDAIGRTINTIGERLDKTPEPERPGKVIIVILTDGLENASQEFNSKQICWMIEHQREIYSWEFIYLGANQDAIMVGERMGIAVGCSTSFEGTPEGMGQAFAAVNQTIGAARAGGSGHAKYLGKAAKKE